MKNIASSVVIRKLNLEQCFRAADSDFDGKVTHKELNNFIESLKLFIPKSHLTRFIHILDEDCSGVITQEEFYKALAAFNINKETHSNSGRLFAQETLLKFSEILNKREIEPEQLFNLCDLDMSGTISLKELEKYLNLISIGLQQKEIAALMNLFDVNGDGEITKEEFSEYLQKANNAIFEVEKPKGTEAAFALENTNSASKSTNIASLLEIDKHTLFDILDQYKTTTTLEDLKKILKNMNKNITDKDLNNVVNLITKQGQDLNRDLVEEFCVRYTDTNMLSKDQYIKRIRIGLAEKKLSIELILKAEKIKGAIEISSLSLILKKYFEFNQSQIVRFLNLVGIDTFVTQEYLIMIIMPANPLLAFSQVLEENKMTLEEFFIKADKNKTGKISCSDFELTAVAEFKNIDGRLLTDLALMFPSPKMDKNSFLKIFQYEPPVVIKNPAEPWADIDKIDKKIEKGQKKPEKKEKKADKPSDQQKIPQNQEFSLQNSKRRGTLFLLGSDKGGDSLRKYISSCEKTTPTHIFLETYGVSLSSLYDLEKFVVFSSKFGITRVESIEIFKTIDKHSIGFFYAYSLVLSLDSLINPLDSVPTQENTSVPLETKSLMEKISKKYNNALPIYKQLPSLDKIVDWAQFCESSPVNVEFKTVFACFPSPCYYYHIAATIQTYQKVEFLCGEQVIMGLIERNSITDQAGDYFSDIECDFQTTRAVFVSKLQKYCSKIEAESIYQYAYESQEHKPAYIFFSLFDCILTQFRNKLQKLPVLPVKNAGKSDFSAADFFKKLFVLFSKPLSTYNLKLLDTNTDIGFGNSFERLFKILRSESLPYLKLFKLSKDFNIRLYHIMYAVDSYRDLEIDAGALAKPVIGMMRDFMPYGASFLYSIGLTLKERIQTSALPNIFNFLPSIEASILIEKIDTGKRGFVFGFEIAAEIDNNENNIQEINENVRVILENAAEKIGSKGLEFEEEKLKEMMTIESFSQVAKYLDNENIEFL